MVDKLKITLKKIKFQKNKMFFLLNLHILYNYYEMLTI